MSNQTSPFFPRRFIRLWSRANIAFYALPLLMVILVLGTLAQRWIDLYQATQIFFSSAFIWVGPIPIPGTPCIMGVMLVALTCKFIFHSEWKWKKAGVHLSHLGVLILLYGALATAWFAEEGSITLLRGEQSSSITDFHERQLIVRNNNDIISALNHNGLHIGDNIDATPFSITILDRCRDCTIVPNSAPAHDAQGMAKAGKLLEQHTNTPNEAQIYGLHIRIDGAEQQNGEYILLDVIKKPVTVTVNDKTYSITLEKSSRTLPFQITLNNFTRTYYPGTDKPQSYSSDITVTDHNSQWPVTIGMNEPLRYRGYTVFQSSFVETAEGTASVLSVVKNQGWIFPYIGTVVLSLGLLLHVLTRFRNNA